MSPSQRCSVHPVFQPIWARLRGALPWRSPAAFPSLRGSPGRVAAWGSARRSPLGSPGRVGMHSLRPQCGPELQKVIAAKQKETRCQPGQIKNMKVSCPVVSCPLVSCPLVSCPSVSCAACSNAAPWGVEASLGPFGIGFIPGRKCDLLCPATAPWRARAICVERQHALLPHSDALAFYGRSFLSTPPVVAPLR